LQQLATTQKGYKVSKHCQITKSHAKGRTADPLSWFLFLFGSACLAALLSLFFSAVLPGQLKNKANRSIFCFARPVALWPGVCVVNSLLKGLEQPALKNHTFYFQVGTFKK
jgi:hypothetical protein